MGDKLKNVLALASVEEKLALAMHLMDKFRLRGRRIEEEGGWGWDLDYQDFVAAMDEFVAAVPDEDEQ